MEIETGKYAEEREWFFYTEVEKIDKERRTHKRALRALIKACDEAVKALDQAMEGPSSMERGRRVIKIANFLEQAKDSASLFGGLKPRRINKEHTPSSHARSAKRPSAGA